MQTLVVASNNKGKLQEIQDILGDFYAVKSMEECGINLEIEENGSTFEENAIIKAKTIFNILKVPTLADDSGLCVPALGGRPGILSARFSRSGLDKDNNAKLLAELVDKNDRSAMFVSVIALISGQDDISIGYGEGRGRILTNPVGENGFGYDPLFYSFDLNKSFGQADKLEKNKVSHRYRALTNLLEKINRKNLRQ